MTHSNENHNQTNNQQQKPVIKWLLLASIFVVIFAIMFWQQKQTDNQKKIKVNQVSESDSNSVKKESSQKNLSEHNSSNTNKTTKKSATSIEASKTIIDASGKPIVIPAHPKRIAIASDREFTELFVSAGIKPIAVASQHEFAPYLQDAIKEIQQTHKVIDLGHHREIDIEALISSKPDLIIMRNKDRYGSPALYDMAIKVAPVVQINSMVSLRTLIDDLGNILGNGISQKLHIRVDTAVAKMANAVKNPSKIKISHGSVYPSELSIFKENTNIASQLIKEAGYARPAIQQTHGEKIENVSTKFSMEHLTNLDGDILFLNKIGTEAEINNMLASNLWSTLRVVQNNAVITTDWRYWNVGGPIAAEMIADDFVKGIKKVGLE